jgi:hypothetical protein
MSASSSDDLQFAKAEPAAFTPGSDAAPALTCGECSQPIAQYYFEANGRVLCASCKGKVERALSGEGTSRSGRIMRAIFFGGGAALLGAAIWFGVAVMFNLEIGLVAILIGWMVGRAVRAGSADRGGRRYQVAAALLTYLSVAMSYGALGIREIVKGDPSAVVSDSTATSGATATAAGTNTSTAASATAARATATSAMPPATGDSAVTATEASGSFAKAIVFMLGFMFLLPVIANLSSMPGGIIGLAILGFGIHQAWKMNAAAEVSFTGPHRVTRPSGDVDASSPAPAT